MDFYAVLDQVLALLRQRGRVSYRALKRQFDLDDAYLDDLKVEIIEVHQCAVDQEGTILVWTGDAASAATPESVQAQAPLAYTPPYLAEKILTSRSALEGERKQVTVLFADLKGSMELLADRDPEEARQLLDPVLERMMAAVHRYEGTVNQIMGDGIMALFGAPIAHEDHAVRACYAALAMQAALRRYSDEVRRTHGLTVHFRIGLNAGEVVVRAISNDLHMDYSAIGQTTHLAARMEQLATPGSILLTAATLRLVEGLVQVTALGPVPVKGLEEPVEVFELTGASTTRRRLQAASARGLTPFVGRQQELEALHQALIQAKAGHGQVVALVGEAGVGKSRLVHEVVHSHRTQDWHVLESASVSYGKATPYFPVIDLLKRYSHIEDHDDTRTIWAKLTGQVLTLDAALQDVIPALLALLDALPDDSPFRQLEPAQRRQRILTALKRVLLRESQVQPLLLVCEDLHWIDTETQALLDSLVESLPTAQLLLLVNYRPEYQHGWGSKTYYTQLRLDPLPPMCVDEFLHALLGDDASLEPLKTLLIERTEGNPFFLEESVRTLVETGVLVGESGAYRLVRDHPTIQVPPTVQAILAARIDRLSQDEKRLLQTAAVIGTEVPFSLLQAIAEMPEDALHRGLTHLQAAEFLYETHLFPERVYTFKHALTHDVAYSSLLHERRRTLHARIMTALEDVAGDRLDEQIERLAYHALRGEVWEKTFQYCQQAGVKVREQSAYREAVAHFEQAINALEHLPKERAILEQAIDLHGNLRLAYLQVAAMPRVLEHLRAAEALAETLGDQRRLTSILASLTQYLSHTGDHDRALETGQRAVALAADSGSLTLQVAADHWLAHVYRAMGDYARALEYDRRIVELIPAERLYERFALGGVPSVQCRASIVRCLAEQGAFAAAQGYIDEAIRIAEHVDHTISLLHAYHEAGYLALRHGDLLKAIPILERGFELCQMRQAHAFITRFTSTLGAAYTLSGRVAEALLLLEQSAENSVATGLLAYYAPSLIHLSGAYLLTGRIEDATAVAEHALTYCLEHKERGNEAMALCALGDIAAQHDSPDVEQAQTHYLQALALATELGMRPLQAHCHLGLGTLYARTGQWEQARAELAAALVLYRDMAMTFWLPQTEAALAQVEEQ